MEYLITGTGSGLGQYLLSELGGTALKHGEAIGKLPRRTYYAIIHCGHPRAAEITPESARQHQEDTKALLSIPHSRFVYISSSDVYPLGEACTEENAMNAEKVRTPYAQSKLMAETLVRLRGSDPLILRPSAMLGRHMENSLVRLLFKRSPKLPAASSTFNYILHEDVLSLIRAALKSGAQGIYNAVSASNITLGKVAALYHKSPVFGSYHYQTPQMSNQKACALCPAFANSSQGNIERYLALRGERP